MLAGGGGGREVVEMSEKGKDGSNGADIATRKELKRASTGAVEVEEDMGGGGFKKNSRRPKSEKSI